MEKCPSGTICFSNYFFLFLIFILFMFSFILYKKNIINEKKKEQYKPIIQEEQYKPIIEEEQYKPIIQDKPIMQKPIIIVQPPQFLTIKEEYNQIGILTGDDKILPLYGRLTFSRSNKWLYYTGTDKFHMIKVPIHYKNRDCTHEYGCEELYDNDIVFIPAYNKEFKVSIYQLDRPRYIPNLI